MHLHQLLNKPYFSSEQKIAISSLFTDIFVCCKVEEIKSEEQNGYYITTINTISKASWIIKKSINSKELTISYFKHFNSNIVITYVYTSNGFIQVDAYSQFKDNGVLKNKTLLFLLLSSQDYRLDLIYNYQGNSRIKSITFNYSYMTFEYNKLFQRHYYSTINFNSRKVLKDKYYTTIPTHLGIFMNEQQVYLNDVIGDLLLESLSNISSNMELYEAKPSDSQKVDLNNALITFAMTIC